MKKYFLVFIAVCLSACSTIEQPQTKTSGSKITTIDIVRVECTGKQEYDTKQDCFKKAVEQVIGIVLVKSTKVDLKNQEVIKSNIITHSAGYVDDYNIISVDKGKNIHYVMDVTVKSSNIQNQILGKFSDSENLNGEMISDKHGSFVNSKKSGDEVLQSVLGTLTTNGFEISKGEITHSVDNRRNSVISIPYTVNWNYNYLSSLNEALKLTQDKGRQPNPLEIYVQSKHPKNFIGSTNVYQFTDVNRVDTIRNSLKGHVNALATFYNHNGKEIHKQCSEAINFLPIYNDMDRIVIRGNEPYYGMFEITIKATDQKINNFAKVELTIDNTGECSYFKQFTKK